MSPARDPSPPPRSGAVHYFRLPRATWEPALRGLRALGFSAVETYVPWSEHELPDGRFDFGEQDRRKDVGAFLDLAHALGLTAIVRPGPHINAELTGFGIPERVLLDPACQARSPRGNPVVLYFPPRMFPVPSYASEAYLGEVRRWFAAVGEVLAPRVRPHGPIEWVQVDNEGAYYFRNGPYGQDYHPDARALFGRFVVARHEDLATAARAHGRPYASAGDITPPERFDPHEPLALHLDWAAFQEHLLTTSLATMREQLRDAGLGHARTLHNISLGEAGLPMSLPALEAELDVVGLDYYHRAGEFETIRRRTLYLAGTSVAPYAPELGVGGPPWFPPLGTDDSLFTALVACAYGLRSFNAYMAVDRDRWYGAPLDDHGRTRAHADAWQRLLGALAELEFERMERPVRVGIVWPRLYMRLSRATHVYGPFSPSIMDVVSGSPVHGCRVDELGLSDVVQVAWWERAQGLAAALDARRIPYVFVDGDALEDRFVGLDLIFVPTFEIFERGLAAKLAGCARRGARVVAGPRRPRRDERGVPHAFDELGLAQLELRDDAAATVSCHVDVLGIAGEPEVGAGLVSTMHVHPDGRRVLFVVNPSADEQRATLPPVLAEGARDLLGATPAPVPPAFRMPPHSVRLLAVCPDRGACS